MKQGGLRLETWLATTLPFSKVAIEFLLEADSLLEPIILSMGIIQVIGELRIVVGDTHKKS